jgi:hypothetical protein
MMSLGPLYKRLQKLEQPHSSRIVGVILIGEGDPEPPHDPSVVVIEVTLGTPSELGEAAGR